MRITDAWFDGDHPNPLHPVGWLIDSVRREVIVPVRVNGRPSDRPRNVVLRVGDTWEDLGDVTRREPEPTLQEIWGD